MLEIENVSFSYGRQPVLEHLSFTARPGQFVSVLGPNGVGKSTLFRCVLGLLGGYEGSIRIGGDEVRQLPPKELARRAAYIPQIAEPVFNYNVIDVVLMGTTGMLSPLTRPGAREREAAEHVLELLGIEHLRNRGICRISGGERQLALIARAMAQNARLLVMDEPTANLDYGNQHRILERVHALTAQGYTVLLSTHNPDHALRFASHVLAMQRNGVFAAGETSEVLTSGLLSEIYGLPVVITETETANGTVRGCTPL